MAWAARAHALVVPADWRDCIAVVASTFHFSERELWSMTARRLRFWHERAAWLVGQLRTGA